MKTTTALALASTLGFALSGLSLAADSQDSAPIVLKEQTTTRATIVTIDNGQRTVTLKGPDGKTMDLIVDEGVTRFDALRVGDIVMAGLLRVGNVRDPGTGHSGGTGCRRSRGRENHRRQARWDGGGHDRPDGDHHRDRCHCSHGDGQERGRRHRGLPRPPSRSTSAGSRSAIKCASRGRSRFW